MHPTLRFLLKLFRGGKALDDVGVWGEANELADECPLTQARHRLESVERLLVNPSPEAIRQGGVLLDEARLMVNHFMGLRTAEPVESPERLRAKVDRFHTAARRVSKLIEGALGIQWAQMRWIRSVTQTYNAGGKTSTWQPRSRGLNLEM